MLTTNVQFLSAEIMDVLRLFGAEDRDFAHTFRRDGDNFINIIECGGECRTFSDIWRPRDELEFKRFAKRSAKLAFYLLLSQESGKSLPWGALTGIRPTKMAYGELAAGRDFAPLFKKFCVSGGNIDIVRRVLAAQGYIYRANCGNGEDIFVSLPFCPTKCEYCSFITAPVGAVEKYIESYINCLVEEIYSLKGIISRVNSVYVGGGTPFCLSAEQLSRVYGAINSLNIGGAEFTVEAGRPDTFTPEKLEVTFRAGVNRICVNPQTFSDKTLTAIGRKHTSEQTFRAYEMASQYPFDINIDLIAGLADENIIDFSRSLDAAIALSPSNITVHSLCLKAGSRLKESVSRLAVSDIDGMIALSREKLTASGYCPYYLYRQKYQAGAGENVGWSLPGRECVYNVDTMEEICSNIAVGAGAISKRVYGGGSRIERLASPKDIPTYLNKYKEIIEKRNELFA